MNIAKKYYQVGGNLTPDNPSYIERQADKKLFNKLKFGSFCYVFNSRQMGKSSLGIRVKYNLEKEGFRCVVISLDKLGSKGVTQEQWYNSLIKNFADTFDLQINPISNLTPLHRLSEFFEKTLLSKVEQNTIIFIDEIDTVLSLDFPTDDFFAFIRYCYNERANNHIYKRVTFALLGVATPSQLIQDKQRTPFNIGEAIQLYGFSLQEARPLVQGLENKVDDAIIREHILREVLNWTGGQPFLTQKIFRIIAEDGNDVPNNESLISNWIEGLVKLRIIENWEYQDEPQHLLTIHYRIINSKVNLVNLLKLYLQILEKKELIVDNSLEQSELILSGLLEERNGKLNVYNRIYESVFNASWVAEMLAEMRPYEEQLLGWLSSNRQDKSWLLQGQKLQTAIAWCDKKILNIEDYQFINASQEVEITNLGINIQKKERFQSFLAGITFSMVVIAGVSGFQLQKTIQSKVFGIPYIVEPEHFSQGERTFFSGDGNYYQKQGVEAFQKKKYLEAKKLFEKSKRVNVNDPEAEIYYNNALAQEQGEKMKTKPVTVAVVVPIYARRESAISILRGVAQAQNDFNSKGGFNGRLLNILIANDNNEPVLAKKVAQELIKDSNVLAVIGHNASTPSKSALDEYQKAELAMISSTSASTDLHSKVFFRTILSSKVAAEYLAKYAIQKNIKKVVIYYQPEDIYSNDIKLNFEIFFKQQGGKVISYVDLKDSQQEASNQFTRTLVSKNPPDAVVFFPSTDLVSTVMEIFATKGELAYIPDKVKFLGGGTLYTSETLKQGKENVKNLTLTVPWFPEEASSEKFAKKACKRWDEKISWGTSSSYDATQAIIKSISQLKNPSRKDVIEKLKVIELPPSETSGDRLKFIDGERQNAKPVLVRVVRGSSKECGSIEENGFHFEQVTDNQ